MISSLKGNIAVKNLLKKIDWACLNSLLPYIVLSILVLIHVHALYDGPTLNSINYVKVAIGLLMLLLATFTLLRMSQYYNLKEPSSLLHATRRIVGVPLTLLMLSGGYIFLMDGTLALTLETLPEKILFVFVENICLVGFVYVLIYQFYLQWQYIVKEETIVLLNETVLYPGTCFSLHPLLKYNLKVLNQKIPVSWHTMVTCSDGYRITVNFETEATIDIERAKQEDLGMFDHTLFKENLPLWLEGCIQEHAMKRTVGEFIKTPPIPQTAILHGVPVIWPGTMKLTLS